MSDHPHIKSQAMVTAPSHSSSLTPPGSSSSIEEDSFYTAVESGQSTTASSPVAPPHRYREARPLPRDLKEHCRILLEEDLYPSAIALLNSILASGTSRRGARAVPIPPTEHLALLGTLTVHPTYTTRATKHEQLEVSCQALSYLRNVLARVGPLHADFRTAFQFVALRWGRRKTFADSGDDSDASEDPGSEDRLRNRLANAGALWSSAQDFWTVIGWAFSCSALHLQRWAYWKAWLEFMLDVLEEDWQEREGRDLSQSEGNAEESFVFREESLICTYLSQHNGMSNGFRGIVKAILADGSSLSSFPEVFEKELRKPKADSKKRKRHEALDLENDKFADYFDDDSLSSGNSEPPTPEKPEKKTTAQRPTFGSASPGLVESVNLRLRLFGIISLATYTLNPRDIGQLYEQFSMSLKVLPVELFALFASAREHPLRIEARVEITRELFRLLLPSSYKDPRKVDSAAVKAGDITMAIMEQCYVGHAANTVGIEENAKLSLVVESAVQMLWVVDGLAYTPDFHAAVKRGIDARKDKTKKKRAAKGRLDPADALAAEVLMESTDRLEVLMEVLEAQGEES